MKTPSRLLSWFVLLLICSGGMAAAAIRTSTSYSVDVETVSAGGGAVSSTAFAGDGSIGGTGVVTSASAAYSTSQGFLAQVTLASEIEVIDQLSALSLVSGQSSVSFGSVNVGLPGASRTFVIKNTGSAPLTGIAVSLSGTHSGDFALQTTGMSLSLAPATQTTFSVVFNPSSSGARSASIEIQSNDGDEPDFAVALAGNGVFTPQLTFLEQPESTFAFLGSRVDLEAAVVSSNPITYQWRKGSANVAGATLTSLALNNLKATDAAKYSLRATNAVDNKLSNEAFVSVVTPAPAEVRVNETQILTLTATVTAPTGVTPVYLWEFNGLPLSNGDRLGRVSGANTKTLKITGAREADGGTYACRLSMTTPQGLVTGSTGETEVLVVLKPILNPLTLDDTYVAEPVTGLFVSAANNPVSFAATGLPPGIKFNTTTGAITGAPTAAKLVKGLPVPYAVKFTATNSAGTSVLALNVNWLILPLVPEVVGTFNGLVSRHAHFNSVVGADEGLGGTVKIITTTTGSLSGTLKLAAQSLPLTGAITLPAGGGFPVATFNVKRTGILPPYIMSFEINPQNETLTGKIAEGAEEVAFSAVRLKWTSTVKPSASRVGLFNAALQPEVPAVDPVPVPEGTGYLIQSVSTTGTVTLGGKLADGTALTGSASLGPDGQVPIHLLLYSTTGSVQGWAVIDDDADGTVSGALDWYKMPQPSKVVTRIYKNGFPLHALNITGAKYLKPGAGAIILGIPAAPLPNARLTLELGGIDTALVNDFTITTANAAQAPTPNPQTLQVTLTAATGLFTGSFTLVEPGLPVVSRKTTFYGAVIPNLRQGVGHFLLPELPNPSTSPMLSGRVVLEEK